MGGRWPRNEQHRKNCPWLAAVGAYFQELLVPVAIVVFVMLCDYVSGVTAAWVKGELSSRVGIIGIVKKVAYALIIVVGIVVDWIVQEAAGKIGIEAGNFYFFGLLVTVWLIVNECISILENVARIGAPVPPFLLALTTKLKNSTKSKGDKLSEE